jgi:hypothetical protein
VLVRLADFIDGDDVRVVDAGGGACLAQKPLARLGRRVLLHVDEFNRDGPEQHPVFRLVDLAHPARPDLRADFVATDDHSFSNLHKDSK